MRRKPWNWNASAIVVLAVFASFAVGSYIATRFVSPCVCIYATPARVN